MTLLWSHRIPSDATIHCHVSREIWRINKRVLRIPWRRFGSPYPAGEETYQALHLSLNLPVLSASKDHTPYLQEKEDPPLPSKPARDTGKQNIRSSSDSNASDGDNFVTRPCSTDSSDGGSASDCEEERSKIPHSEELSSDSKHDHPSSSPQTDFLPLSSIKAGMLPCPTESPASGKMQGQWEIPLSFHPHDIPTATLASGTTAHTQASVQSKSEAPQANSKSGPSPAATNAAGDL